MRGVLACIDGRCAVGGQVERLVSKARVWKESEHLFAELNEAVQRFMDEVRAAERVPGSRIPRDQGGRAWGRGSFGVACARRAELCRSQCAN